MSLANAYDDWKSIYNVDRTSTSIENVAANNVVDLSNVEINTGGDGGPISSEEFPREFPFDAAQNYVYPLQPVTTTTTTTAPPIMTMSDEQYCINYCDQMLPEGGYRFWGYAANGDCTCTQTGDKCVSVCNTAYPTKVWPSSYYADGRCVCV